MQALLPYHVPVGLKSSPRMSMSNCNLRRMCLIYSTIECRVKTCLLIVLSHSASIPPLRQTVVSFFVDQAYRLDVFENSSMISSEVRSSYGLAFLLIDCIIRTVNYISCLWWKQLRVQVQHYLKLYSADCLRIYKSFGMVNNPLTNSDAFNERNAVGMCRKIVHQEREQTVVCNFSRTQHDVLNLQPQIPTISNRFKRQILYDYSNLTLFFLFQLGNWKLSRLILMNEPKYCKHWMNLYSSRHFVNRRSGQIN